MFSEHEKRRSDFKPGVPVTLADGQDWELCRPLIRFIPDDTDVGYKVVIQGMDDGYSALIAAREKAVTDSDLFKAELAMGRAILTANYDLTTTEIGSLLQFGYSATADPEGAQIRADVMAVATGNDPKPLGGGDESFPMPGD